MFLVKILINDFPICPEEPNIKIDTSKEPDISEKKEVSSPENNLIKNLQLGLLIIILISTIIAEQYLYDFNTIQ